MSAVTPTHILQQLVTQKEQGVIVESRDYKKYMLDLQGWFMWNGRQYKVRGRTLGAGLTQMTAVEK